MSPRSKWFLWRWFWQFWQKNSWWNKTTEPFYWLDDHCNLRGETRQNLRLKFEVYSKYREEDTVRWGYVTPPKKQSKEKSTLTPQKRPPLPNRCMESGKTNSTSTPPRARKSVQPIVGKVDLIRGSFRCSTVCGKKLCSRWPAYKCPQKKTPSNSVSTKAQKRHSSKVPKAVKKDAKLCLHKKTRIIISTGLLPVIVIAVSTASVISQRSQHKKANRLYCMHVWV